MISFLSLQPTQEQVLKEPAKEKVVTETKKTGGVKITRTPTPPKQPNSPIEKESK